MNEFDMMFNVPVVKKKAIIFESARYEILELFRREKNELI